MSNCYRCPCNARGRIVRTVQVSLDPACLILIDIREVNILITGTSIDPYWNDAALRSADAHVIAETGSKARVKARVEILLGEAEIFEAFPTVPGLGKVGIA